MSFITLRSREVPRVQKLKHTLDIHPETEIKPKCVQKQDVYQIFSQFSSTKEQPYRQYLDEQEEIRHIEVNAQILLSQAKDVDPLRQIGKLQMVKDIYLYIQQVSCERRLGRLNRMYKNISKIQIDRISDQISSLHSKYSITQILKQTLGKSKLRDPSIIIAQYL